ARTKDPQWMVINGNDFYSELLGRQVKPSDPLLRLGEISGAWEVEVKIPQKHIGQVMKAFDELARRDPGADELDVELKLESAATESYRGKLKRSRVEKAAVPNRDDHNETEPVVYAYVRVRGDDIPVKDQIPDALYLTGVEVRANIRCGTHSMGYSLFYGVFEFVHQKIFQFL